MEPRVSGSRWWVVFASVLGLLVGQGPINIFAFAVFLKPVSEGLGIGRGTLSSGVFVGSLVAAVGSPIVGRLIDRWGIRPVLLPAIVAYALATAAMALLSPAAAVLYGLFALAGLTGAAQLPTPYAKAIAEWFDHQRGLALGIAMAGTGLGIALIPQWAALLIRHFGWRAAYVGLGVAVFVIAFAPVAAFVRDAYPPAGAGRSRTGAGHAAIPGVTAREALTGSWRFWALLVAFLFGAAAINGTLTQVVALLTDRGLPAQYATAALSSAGLALIGGRVFSGFLLDRIFGPYVAVFFLLCPMAGIGLLASGMAGPVPVLGVILCGVGIGAEVDLMAFFASRYFGLRAFGEIYGYLICILSVGTGLGPFLMGRSFDLLHSYRPMLLGFEIMLAIACLLLVRLGPYPYPAPRTPDRRVIAAQPD